jgi:hypothetical protein
MKDKCLITVVLILAWSLCQWHEAHADGDPLPIGENLTPQQIDERMAMVEVEPAADSAFAHRLLVPRDWIRDSEVPGLVDGVSAGRLTPLSAFRVADDDQGHHVAPVTFLVQAMALEREVSAADFLRVYGRSRGMELLAMREMSPGFTDALVRQDIEGEPFIVRLLARFDGPRVYLLSGLAHALDYPEHEIHFGLMVASFEPLSLHGRSSVETRSSADLLDRVRFEFPSSWRQRPVGDSSDTHAALDLLATENGGVIGFIRIELDTLPDEFELEAEMGRVRGQAEAMGMEFVDEYRTVELSGFPPPINARAMRVYQGRHAASGQPQEVPIAVLDTGHARLRIWSARPALHGDLHHYSAIGRRAYFIVLDSLAAIE